MMPMHEDLLRHWRKHKETDPILKALRFLFLSNFTFMGNGETLRIGTENPKIILLGRIKQTLKFLENVQFCNRDFRNFFDQLRRNHNNQTFIYCDPPYLQTGNNYKSGFTERDSGDLFDCLQAYGSKWIMSEFAHPFIVEQAKERDLIIQPISERRNLGNRQTEIIVKNFETINLFTNDKEHHY